MLATGVTWWVNNENKKNEMYRSVSKLVKKKWREMFLNKIKFITLCMK